MAVFVVRVVHTPSGMAQPQTVTYYVEADTIALAQVALLAEYEHREVRLESIEKLSAANSAAVRYGGAWIRRI